MSKEEIEQLAQEVHYEFQNQGLNADGCFNQYQGFIKGYTRCQKDMAKDQTFTRADVNYLMYKATRWDTFKEDEPEYKMDVYEFFDYIVEKLNKN